MGAGVVFLDDGIVPVSYKGKEYNLLFSIDVIDFVQREYGGLYEIGNVLTTENPDLYKDLKEIIRRLINAGRNEGEPEIADHTLSQMINSRTYIKLIQLIGIAVYEGAGLDIDDEEIEGEGEDDEGD